jgi:DegV family protein with EDD domain
MARVAVVTDSTADLPPGVAAANGIRIVPLLVTFGDEEFRAGVDLSTDEFWKRMLAPGAPWPRTAASAPGVFAETYERCFADGADAVVCVTISAKLSASHKSAEMGAQMLPGREIHVIDSATASMGEGILALLGTELAAAGASGAEVAATVRARAADIDLYVALDTLEYLRKGGRIGAARATLGTVLAVKPIITVKEGIVETVETPRTRSKARERVLDLVTRRPVERIAILHTPGGGMGDLEAFRAEVVGRLPGGVDPARVSLDTIGASVGPHVGPGCLGAVFLLRR